jgi:hypothetical protein
MFAILPVNEGTQKQLRDKPDEPQRFRNPGFENGLKPLIRLGFRN